MAKTIGRNGGVGGPGAAPGEFNFPQAIAVHPITGESTSATSATAGSSGSTRHGAHLGSFGTCGYSTTQIQFAGVSGLAFAADGTLFVADYQAHRVAVINPDGTLREYWGRRGASGVGGGGLGHFSYPEAVTIDAGGRVIVADRGNGRLQAFDLAGTWLSAFGKPGSAFGHFDDLTSVRAAPSGDLVAAEFGSSPAVGVGRGRHAAVPVRHVGQRRRPGRRGRTGWRSPAARLGRQLLRRHAAAVHVPGAGRVDRRPDARHVRRRRARRRGPERRRGRVVVRVRDDGRLTAAGPSRA